MNTVEYDKLLVASRYWLQGKSENDSRYLMVLKALDVAQKYHIGVRKDGTTKEFYHQLNMFSFARTLVGYFNNPHVLLTTILLHDTYEDYPESHKELYHTFPDVIEYIVRISKVRGGKDIEYPQYFGEMTTCPYTSVGKVIDRIHNVSTMVGVFDDEKIYDYLHEVDVYFLPMIKSARRNFPELEPVYELLKHTLVLLVNAVRNGIK